MPDVLPSQRLWRTLIRVEHFNDSFAYFKIWAYDTRATIEIPLSDLPEGIKKRIEAYQIHFHARVNIGAEKDADLRFEDWENS